MAPRLNIPPVTRALMGALLFQSLLSAVIRYRQWSANTIVLVPYLVLVPQLSAVYLWTFVSTTLVEGNVFTLAIALVTLYQGGRYLERAWSGRELAKFLLVVSLVPNFLCFVTLYTLFSLTRREGWT
jgi:membrane associated rhomboid family serine protease